MPPESCTSARTRMLAAPAASAGTKKSAFSCVRKRGRPPGAKRWRSAAATWNATVKVWAASSAGPTEMLRTKWRTSCGMAKAGTSMFVAASV